MESEYIMAFGVVSAVLNNRNNSLVSSPFKDSRSSSGFTNVSYASRHDFVSLLSTVLMLRQLMDSKESKTRPGQGVALANESSKALTNSVTDEPGVSSADNQQGAQQPDEKPFAVEASDTNGTTASLSFSRDFDIPTRDAIRVIHEAGFTKNGKTYGANAEELTAYIQKVGANSYKGQIALYIRDELLPKYGFKSDDFFKGRIAEEAFVGLANSDGNLNRLTRREIETHNLSYFKGDGRRDAPLNFLNDVKYQAAIGQFYGEYYRTGIHPLDKPVQ